MTFIADEFLFRVFWPMYDIWHYMLLGLSLLTIVVGNLFCPEAENIKRFLAFFFHCTGGLHIAGHQ